MSEQIGRFATARDERVASRLETFGDIVIGFSLAQLALSFTFPDLLTVTRLLPELTAFAWTFGMTAWLWTLYRRIGADYFVPGPWASTLYMLGLAGVVLLIFAVQLVMHYGTLRGATSAEIDLAVIFYFIVLAVTLAVVGLQFATGVRARGEHLEPGLRRAGLLSALRLVIMGICVAVAIAVLPGRAMSGTAVLLPAMVGGGVLGRVVSSFLLRSAPE
ncbi:MAG: hypothetical protein M3R30_08960 [Candidatus Eremiobacteraeota bacterium]|nr:hypothetical protein [Candidatus Eremiobacteraeota bacterium]